MKTTIEVEGMITVGALADKLALPVAKIITELMKNGVMATVNEKIDFETAQIITEELGLEVELVKKEEAPAAFKQVVYEKTGIPVDRMKIMVKGGILKVCHALAS